MQLSGDTYGFLKKITTFFEHFEIDEIERHILLKIIPREYFMKIDNFKFDKSIKELISNFEKKTFSNKIRKK